MLKKLMRAAYLTVAIAGASAHAAYPQVSGAGIIEDIDFDTSTLIIEGLRYRVAVDANITIDGTFGAFTMLTKGRTVRFEYLVVSDREREILVLETRPGGEAFESS